MRAERLLSMILLLENSGHLKAEQLADRLGVSERTIYRDVEALSLAGVPVYTQTGGQGGIFLEESYRLSLNGLNRAEVMALFALPTGGPLHDLGLTGPHDNILLKLLAALPQLQQNEALRLRQRLHIDSTEWFRDEEPVEWLHDLQQAVWADREVVLAYLSKDGRRSERRIQPYGLVAKSSVWYLVGRQMDGGWRTFRISRIVELTVHATQFSRPDEFDLAEHWQAVAGQFENQFKSPKEQTLVRCRIQRENFWMLSYNFSGQLDILSDPEDDWMVVEVSSSYPLAMVIRMGTTAEVLAPKWLRAALREAALEIAEFYAT